MKSFSNLKIAIRMALGTGLILVLLTVVAVTAFFGLAGGVEGFAEYRLLARQSVTLGTIEANALETRLAFRLFLSAQTDESADIVTARLKEAIDYSTAAIDQFHTDESRQKITGVIEMLKQYETAFNRIAELRKLRNPLVAHLDEVGPGIEKNLTAIMESANRDADLAAEFAAGETMRSLMLGRLYTQKYLRDNSQESLDRVHTEMADADSKVEAMLTQLQQPARREQATQADAAIEEYAATFGQITPLIVERNELISGTMQTVGAEISSALDAMADESQARQDELGPLATAAMVQAEWTAGIIAIVALLIGAGVAFVLATGITRPVVGMTKAMERLAGGDKTIAIPATDRKDEIGQMAKTVLVFKESMIKADQLAAQEAEAVKVREARGKAIEKLTDDFDADVTMVLKTVSSAATEMQATASSMTATAEETSRQSTAVAAASEEASTNVQTVAAAAEELSASVNEITRQVAQSAQIAAKAVTDAEHTNIQIQGLAEAAQKIGEVVSLITDIASQTNLLALNATIEAARAGESGKGFAVVASEVKNLANETAKATEEITGQITSIQNATKEAVTAIQSIGKTIGQINEIATTIASAVEEQGAATQEIARNVQQAAQGTNEVSSNISGVTQAAASTGAAAEQLLGAAGELSKQSETLRGQVETFLAGVKAA